MAHMKKRMTFHGIEYIVVPVELWGECKQMMLEASCKCSVQYSEVCFDELHANMIAYEGSDEPTELNDE